MLTLDFEDIRLSNEEFNKLQLIDYSIFFLSGVSIGVSVISQELEYFYGKSEGIESNVNLMLRLNLVATLLLCFTLVHRALQYINWGISKRYYTRIDTLYTTKHFKQLCLEIIIALIGPYEFFNNLKVEEYSSQLDLTYHTALNEWLSVLGMFKVFFWLRAIMYLTKFTKPRAQRVC